MKADGQKALDALQQAWNASDREWKIDQLGYWVENEKLDNWRQRDVPEAPTVPDDLAALSDEQIDALYEECYGWIVECGEDFTGEEYETLDGREGFDAGMSFAMTTIREAFGLTQEGEA